MLQMPSFKPQKGGLQSTVSLSPKYLVLHRYLMYVSWHARVIIVMQQLHKEYLIIEICQHFITTKVIEDIIQSLHVGDDLLQ